MPGNDIHKIYLYGKIVVGAVMLVMQAFGIKVNADKSTMERTVTRTAEAIRRSSAFQRAIRAFMRAWQEAGNSRMKQAQAIVFLVKETNAAGFLKIIFQCLFFSMSKWDWAKTFLTGSAMFLAAFASDGLALVARIALLVFGAFSLVEDIEEAINLE